MGCDWCGMCRNLESVICNVPWESHVEWDIKRPVSWIVIWANLALHSVPRRRDAATNPRHPPLTWRELPGTSQWIVAQHFKTTSEDHQFAIRREILPRPGATRSNVEKVQLLLWFSKSVNRDSPESRGLAAISQFSCRGQRHDVARPHARRGGVSAKARENDRLLYGSLRNWFFFSYLMLFYNSIGTLQRSMVCRLVSLRISCVVHDRSQSLKVRCAGGGGVRRQSARSLINGMPPQSRDPLPISALATSRPNPGNLHRLDGYKSSELPRGRTARRTPRAFPGQLRSRLTANQAMERLFAWFGF